jgi:hypothetical protein
VWGAPRKARNCGHLRAGCLAVGRLGDGLLFASLKLGRTWPSRRSRFSAPNSALSMLLCDTGVVLAAGNVRTTLTGRAYACCGMPTGRCSCHRPCWAKLGIWPLSRRDVWAREQVVMAVSRSRKRSIGFSCRLNWVRIGSVL